MWLLLFLRAHAVASAKGFRADHAHCQYTAYILAVHSPQHYPLNADALKVEDDQTAISAGEFAMLL